MPSEPGRARPTRSSFEAWESSPFSDDYLGRMAIASVDALKLGQGTGTDFLGVSFSALDLVGHDFGPASHEVQDTLVRLDRTLGALLAHLDRTVGAGNYVVALTADHGAAPIPGAGGGCRARRRPPRFRRRAPGGPERDRGRLRAGLGPVRSQYSDLILPPGVVEQAAAQLPGHRRGAASDQGRAGRGGGVLRRAARFPRRSRRPRRQRRAVELLSRPERRPDRHAEALLVLRDRRWLAAAGQRHVPWDDVRLRPAGAHHPVRQGHQAGGVHAAGHARRHRADPCVPVRRDAGARRRRGPGEALAAPAPSAQRGR